MQQHGLIHPHMMGRIQPNFYPSLCTIGARSTAQDEYGQEIGTVTPVGGLTDLACRIAPRGATETRSAQQIYATSTHHVALNGYYPAIAPHHVATVDGIDYDIEGVEHDGNHETTRLFVRRVI